MVIGNSVKWVIVALEGDGILVVVVCVTANCNVVLYSYVGRYLRTHLCISRRTACGPGLVIN